MSKAYQAFELNMSDAHILVGLAKLLRNQRINRMRKELRERVGTSLGIPKRDWDELECLENNDVFVTFKPGRREWRGRLNEESLRPLLRQAVVAACAAVETYVADRVIELYPRAIRSDPVPPRLLALTMTVDDWLRIEKQYQRKHWGLRNIVELEIRQRSSPTPTVIGELFSMVNQKDVFKKIDVARKVGKGTSATQLDAIRERRNQIAHTGDRKGRGRAGISVTEVETYLSQVESIVDALADITA